VHKPELLTEKVIAEKIGNINAKVLIL